MEKMTTRQRARVRLRSWLMLALYKHAHLYLFVSYCTSIVSNKFVLIYHNNVTCCNMYFNQIGYQSCRELVNGCRLGYSSSVVS